jgi:hypothetical protein
MRAIIVSSKDRTITETDIDGSLKTLQQIVGGLIEPAAARGQCGHTVIDRRRRRGALHLVPRLDERTRDFHGSGSRASVVPVRIDLKA